MGNVGTIGTKRPLADALTASVRRIRLAEAEQLRIVCELVDAYRTVPDLPVPGAPQLRPSGADGTPDVDEFLVNEIAPLLGVSTASAWALIHDAINLRERHPHSWNLTQTAQVPSWQARQVAQACANLSAEDARTIDSRIAPALAALPWSRAKRRLTGYVLAADAAAARERAVHARQERHVRITHTGDGASWLVAHLSTADAITLGHTIDGIARQLVETPGYPGSLDHARADALAALGRPSVTTDRLTHTTASATPAETGKATDTAQPAYTDRTNYTERTVNRDRTGNTDQPAAADQPGDPTRATNTNHSTRGPGLPRPVATMVVHISHSDLQRINTDRHDVHAGRRDPGHASEAPPPPPPTGNPDDSASNPRSSGPPVSLESPDPPTWAPTAHIEGLSGLDDIGPMLLDQIRELLAHHHVRVQPVIDLNTDPATDSYAIPARIRQHVILRDQVSVFPFGTRSARSCDLDHTHPWQPDGPPNQTRASNLGALDRKAHRAKTHAGWTIEQPTPGTFTWTSPLGYHYQVDQHGTHPIAGAEAGELNGNPEDTEQAYGIPTQMTNPAAPGTVEHTATDTAVTTLLAHMLTRRPRRPGPIVDISHHRPIRIVAS